MADMVQNVELLSAASACTDLFVRYVLYSLAMGVQVLRAVRSSSDMNFVRCVTEPPARPREAEAETDALLLPHQGLPSAATILAADSVNYCQFVRRPEALAALFHAIVVLWAPQQYQQERGMFHALAHQPRASVRRTRQAKCAALMVAMQRQAEIHWGTRATTGKRQLGADAGTSPGGGGGGTLVGDANVEKMRPHFGFLLRHNMLQVATTAESITILPAAASFLLNS